MNLLSITVEECLNNAVAKNPSGTALIESQSGRTMTWQALSEEADAVACGFLAAGLRKGDRLGIWSANSIEWVICFLAAAKIGLPVVCINFHFKKRELLDLFRLTNLKALCFSDGFRENDFVETVQSLAMSARPDGVSVPRVLIGIGKKSVSPAFSLTELKERGKSVSSSSYFTEASKVSAADMLTVQLTSGSTAAPKGVMLSHYSVINNAILSAGRLGVTQRDTLCLAVPLFHCFGLSSGLFFSLTTGCRLVLLDNYSPEDVLKAVQTYRCTVMHGVPTIFSRLMRHARFADYDVSSLAKGIVAGAAVPIGLIEEISTRLGMKEVAVSYGQTEASPCCTQTLPGDPVEIKGRTVGKPLPFVEMRIASLKNGKTCPPGARGEICTRGFHVMMGYDGEPEKTQEAIDEQGWLHTGDVGYVDADGYYHYAYRIKEIVVRGGENVSLREIEEAVMEYSGVEAAKAFGIPSEDLGEEVAAAVCVHEEHSITETGLREFLRQRLARYKMPKDICFFSQFPHTPCGKIDVQVLKSQMGYGARVGKEEANADN